MTTELATRPTAAVSIIDRLSSDNVKHQIAKVLPTGLAVERFTKCAAVAVQRNPDLARCSWESFYSALLTCGQFSVEPDGRNGHLVPFWSSKKNCFEAQFLWDWKGLCAKAMETGKLSGAPVLEIVCWEDDFVYNKGRIERHIIDYKKPRGKPYLVYSLVHFVAGGESACVMGLDEVEEVRKKSKQPDSLMWKDFYEQGALKTVFKRHSKRLSLSPDFDRAVAADNEVEGITLDVSPPPANNVPAAPQIADRPVPAAKATVTVESAPRRGPGRPPKVQPPTETQPPQAPASTIPVSTAPASTAPAEKKLPAHQARLKAWMTENEITFDEVVAEGNAANFWGDNVPASIEDVDQMRADWLVKEGKVMADLIKDSRTPAE